MKVLSRDMTGVKFAVTEVIEKVKHSQHLGYDYRIFTTKDLLHRPIGMMQMMNANIRRFICNGDVFAVDVQSKTKNTYN